MTERKNVHNKVYRKQCCYSYIIAIEFRLVFLTWILSAEGWVEAGGKAWSAISSSGSKTYNRKEYSISNVETPKLFSQDHVINSQRRCMSTNLKLDETTHLYIDSQLNLKLKIWIFLDSFTITMQYLWLLVKFLNIDPGRIFCYLAPSTSSKWGDEVFQRPDAPQVTFLPRNRQPRHQS